MTSCSAFTALLAIGILVFLTSKIALDTHLMTESNADQSLSGSPQRDRYWHLNRVASHSNKLIAVIKDLIDQNFYKTELPEKRHDDLLKFPSTCKLSNNLIKYWAEETDRFESLLRNSSGLSAKRVEDRRYLLFQPDLGGWNNIRMGKIILSLQSSCSPLFYLIHLVDNISLL